MRTVAALCAVLLLGGCASRGKVAPPDPATTRLPVEEGECAGCPVLDELQPLPAPVEAMPLPEVVPSMETECLQAVRLSEVGEHKPAVETLDLVLQAGASCGDPVLEAIEDSQRRLDEADDLVRLGLEARGGGDIAAARESFRLALAVYPKYYWVQKLEQDLPPESSREVVDLQGAASKALASGRLEEALALLDQALALPSAGPEIAEEAGRVRAELAASRLGEARMAQRTGNLAHALARTEEALAVRPEPPLQEQVVDFARRLGLNLFSSGELVKARDLWRSALELDQANALLRQYLDEVDARLRTLDAIKDDG